MKKEERKIKLSSRGVNNWLEPYEDNVYILKSELDHIRVGFDKNPDDIVFIDPPGGPFMRVESTIDIGGVAKTIESIFRVEGKGYAIKIHDLSS